ncbi:MAG: isochorismatase family protein [Gemmatimonadota bacterium]
MDRALHVRPRYHRWHVDPGVEWVETSTGYAHLDWTIPLARAAVVLVDVWNGHYLADTAARAEVIIRERLRPLLAACRAAGLQVVHAPSPPQAHGHPAWVRLAEEDGGAEPSWPPPDFRSKAGAFAAYAKPAEPRQGEIDRIREARTIHPEAEPQGAEVVIATGEELHRYCAREGILFLFYAGFNTNACILLRDYGTIEMGRRGYEVAILRDCTTGMESAQTQAALGQTRGAILLLEMFGKYSLTSEELIAGLPAAGPAAGRR